MLIDGFRRMMVQNGALKLWKMPPKKILSDSGASIETNPGCLQSYNKKGEGDVREEEWRNG